MRPDAGRPSLAFHGFVAIGYSQDQSKTKKKNKAVSPYFVPLEKISLVLFGREVLYFAISHKSFSHICLDPFLFEKKDKTIR
jgi:hypothetical protein